jgi:hypothetical protein
MRRSFKVAIAFWVADASTTSSVLDKQLVNDFSLFYGNP